MKNKAKIDTIKQLKKGIETTKNAYNQLSNEHWGQIDRRGFVDSDLLDREQDVLSQLGAYEKQLDELINIKSKL